MSHDYWIFGPGRMGSSLGSVLLGAGTASRVLFVGRRARPPAGTVFSSPAARYVAGPPGPPPAATRVLLAVPDGALGPVAAQLAALGAPGEGCTALHLSGVQPAGVLAPLAACGYAIGSLHPLQTVADPEGGARRLRGAFFTFEGDAGARAAAAEIVAAAGGQLLEVHAADKVRYHAACVFASNYLVVCASVATRLLAAAANVSQEEAARALRPLWRGAVANLDELEPPRALTGPVARGDLDTIRRHLAALDGDTRDLYRKLAREALELSRQMGLDLETARQIEAELIGNESGGTNSDEVVRQSRPRRHGPRST